MFSRSFQHLIFAICILLLLAKVHATDESSSLSIQRDPPESSGGSNESFIEITGAASANRDDVGDVEINDLLRLIGFEISQTTTSTNDIDIPADLEQALTATSSSNQVETFDADSPDSESSSTNDKPEELTVTIYPFNGDPKKETKENSPSSSLGQKDQDEESTENEGNDEENGEKCPICLEQLKESEIVGTWCSHRFHKACLNKWRQRGKSSCPICRARIPNFASNVCILCGLRLICDSNCINECGHRFHTECLKLWLKYNGFDDIKICPKCLDADPTLNLNLEGWLYQQHKTRLNRPN